MGCGFDDSYSNMSQKDQDSETAGNAFDISWITVVCIKLKEMKQGKKPKVRIGLREMVAEHVEVEIG